MKPVLFLAVASASFMLQAADADLASFGRLPGEADDTLRFQRAIDAAPGGVLSVPAGTYRLSAPLRVANLCSLSMHKNATLLAVKPMECVLKVDNSLHWSHPEREGRHDYGTFVVGGRIDGNGLASCMTLDAFCHYTLRDVQFFNGKAFGLQVNGEKRGCELIAENLYFRCFLRGLAGNTAVKIMGSDSHYTDVIVTDYTVGFDIARGGSNRLTRCHVWGGPLPPAREGEEREMLKGSVCFRIGEDAGSNILRDCYADSGKIGYLNYGWETRLLGCSYYNNKGDYGLEDVTIISQPGGSMLVSDCVVVKSCDQIRIYEGNGKVAWRNMMYSCFGDGRPLPGQCVFDGGGHVDLGR